MKGWREQRPFSSWWAYLRNTILSFFFVSKSVNIDCKVKRISHFSLFIDFPCWDKWLRASSICMRYLATVAIKRVICNYFYDWRVNLQLFLKFMGVLIKFIYNLRALANCGSYEWDLNIIFLFSLNFFFFFFL